jgi:enamine deaminase RidA (YjgF/YER057c/UK114 family)
MKKTIVNNLNIAQINHDDITEFFIDTQCKTTDNSVNALANLFNFLQDTGANAANIRIYATDNLVSAILKYYGDKLNDLACPVTWISQPDKEMVFPLSFQVHAVSGIQVQPLIFGNKKLGCSLACAHADYAYLHILPENKNATNFDQAIVVFNQMQCALNSIGLDFSNTLRTWLFVNDILSWYEQLNKARDNFYARHGIFNKLVPASTGIGLANPAGCALTTELFAVRPKNGTIRIEKVTSPMQCEALDYKSSFSRATKLTSPGHSRMYISGTASIAQNGDTLFLDDTANQIEMTLKVADALIKNGGMAWLNTVLAMVYFKNNKDFSLFDECCKRFSIDIPHVKIQADICRHDLLFEIEMTLIKTT